MVARRDHASSVSALQARERGNEMLPSTPRAHRRLQPQQRVRVGLLEATNRRDVDLVAMALSASVLAIIAAILRWA